MQGRLSSVFPLKVGRQEDNSRNDNILISVSPSRFAVLDTADGGEGEVLVISKKFEESEVLETADSSLELGPRL